MRTALHFKKLLQLSKQNRANSHKSHSTSQLPQSMLLKEETVYCLLCVRNTTQQNSPKLKKQNQHNVHTTPTKKQKQKTFFCGGCVFYCFREEEQQATTKQSRHNLIGFACLDSIIHQHVTSYSRNRGRWRDGRRHASI
jgi:hypothetical protein